MIITVRVGPSPVAEKALAPSTVMPDTAPSVIVVPLGKMIVIMLVPPIRAPSEAVSKLMVYEEGVSVRSELRLTLDTFTTVLEVPIE